MDSKPEDETVLNFFDDKTVISTPAPKAASTALIDRQYARRVSPLVDDGASFLAGAAFPGRVRHAQDSSGLLLGTTETTTPQLQSSGDSDGSDDRMSLGLLPNSCIQGVSGSELPLEPIQPHQSSATVEDKGGDNHTKLHDSGSSREVTGNSANFQTVKKCPQMGPRGGAYAPQKLFGSVQEMNESDADAKQSSEVDKKSGSVSNNSSKGVDSGVGQTAVSGVTQSTLVNSQQDQQGDFPSAMTSNMIGAQASTEQEEADDADHTVHQVALEAEDLEELEQDFSDLEDSFIEDPENKEPNVEAVYNPIPNEEQPAADGENSSLFGPSIQFEPNSQNASLFGSSIPFEPTSHATDWGPSIDFGSPSKMVERARDVALNRRDLSAQPSMKDSWSVVAPEEKFFGPDMTSEKSTFTAQELVGPPKSVNTSKDNSKTFPPINPSDNPFRTLDLGDSSKLFPLPQGIESFLPSFNLGAGFDNVPASNKYKNETDSGGNRFSSGALEKKKGFEKVRGGENDTFSFSQLEMQCFEGDPFSFGSLDTKDAFANPFVTNEMETQDVGSNLFSFKQNESKGAGTDTFSFRGHESKDGNRADAPSFSGTKDKGSRNNTFSKDGPEKKDDSKNSTFSLSDAQKKGVESDPFSFGGDDVKSSFQQDISKGNLEGKDLFSNTDLRAANDPFLPQDFGEGENLFQEDFMDANAAAALLDADEAEFNKENFLDQVSITLSSTQLNKSTFEQLNITDYMLARSEPVGSLSDPNVRADIGMPVCSPPPRRNKIPLLDETKDQTLHFMESISSPPTRLHEENSATNQRKAQEMKNTATVNQSVAKEDTILDQTTPENSFASTSRALFASIEEMLENSEISMSAPADRIMSAYKKKLDEQMKKQQAKAKQNKMEEPMKTQQAKSMQEELKKQEGKSEGMKKGETRDEMHLGKPADMSQAKGNAKLASEYKDVVTGFGDLQPAGNQSQGGMYSEGPTQAHGRSEFQSKTLPQPEPSNQQTQPPQPQAKTLKNPTAKTETKQSRIPVSDHTRVQGHRVMAPGTKSGPMNSKVQGQQVATSNTRPVPQPQSCPGLKPRDQTLPSMPVNISALSTTDVGYTLESVTLHDMTDVSLMPPPNSSRVPRSHAISRPIVSSQMEKSQANDTLPQARGQNMTLRDMTLTDMSEASAHFVTLSPDETGSFLHQTKIVDKFAFSTPLNSHPGEPPKFATGSMISEKSILPMVTPKTVSNMIEVPDVVHFTEVCCVMLSLQMKFVIRNLLPRGVRCHLTVREVTFQHRKIAAHMCPFDIKGQVVLQPEATESVQILFRPKDQGEFTARVEILAQNLNGPETRMYTVLLSAFAEYPSLRISPKDDKLDFGTMLWGSTEKRTLKVQNVGRATVPLRFSIFRTDSPLCNFSFHPESSRDISSISFTTRPMSVGSVFSLTLPGRSEGEEIHTQNVDVYCMAKGLQNSSHKYLEQREKVQAVLTLGVDMPIELAPLSTVTLGVTVGMYKLHVDADSLTLSCIPGQVAKKPLKVINSGNIPMPVTLFLEQSEDHFALSCSELDVPPGDHRVVEVSFTPSGDGPREMKANLVLQNQRMDNFVVVTGKKSSQTKISSLTRSINFGGVDVGQSSKEKFTFITDSDATVQLWIKTPGTAFRILSAEGAYLETLELFVTKGVKQDVWVVFSPSDILGYQAGLVLQTLYGNRFTVPISGYGGCCKLEVNQIHQNAAGEQWIDLGNLTPSEAVVRKLSVANRGARCCFVKVVIQDASGVEFSPHRATVMPNSFVMGPNTAQELFLKLSPSVKERDACRMGRALVGALKLTCGEEILRQMMLRHSDKRHKSSSFDFPVPDRLKDLVEAEMRSVGVPSDSYSSFKQNLSVMKVSVFGEGPQPAERLSSVAKITGLDRNMSNTSKTPRDAPPGSYGVGVTPPAVSTVYGGKPEALEIMGSNTLPAPQRPALAQMNQNIDPSQGKGQNSSVMTLKDGVIQAANMAMFPHTMLGSTSSLMYAFENTSDKPVRWKVAQFTPAYVKQADDSQSVLRVNYNVFTLSPSTGVLQPNNMEMITIEFTPQSSGSYNQTWVIHDVTAGGLHLHKFSVYAKALPDPSNQNRLANQIPHGMTATLGSPRSLTQKTQRHTDDQTALFAPTHPNLADVNGQPSNSQQYTKEQISNRDQTNNSQVTGPDQSSTGPSDQLSGMATTKAQWTAIQPQEVTVHTHNRTGSIDSSRSSVSAGSNKSGRSSRKSEISNQSTRSDGKPTSKTSLHIVESTLQFPSLNKGESTVCKIHIKNGTPEDRQMTVVHEPKAPFIITHKEFSVGKSRMVMFPVTFKPLHSAKFYDLIVFKDRISEETLMVSLTAECLDGSKRE